ncbi:MAG: hypothetical protein Q8N96_04375 [Methylovulum sp.]|nr:hypothetical protein [Methylovulum sp.]
MSQAIATTCKLIIIDSQINNWQRLASDVGVDTAVLILNPSSDHELWRRRQSHHRCGCRR